ncbi:MAG: hypothetical protein ABSF65_05615 [Candidatus Bathyarchaeia archaeon]
MSNEQTEILKQILEELKEIKEELQITKDYVFSISNPEGHRLKAEAEARKDLNKKIEENKKLKIDAKTGKKMNAF